MRHLPVTITPFRDGDLPFLQAVYASTRSEELKLTDWSEQAKSSFLELQFKTQHQYYQRHYRNAKFDIIMLDGRKIGRLYHLWGNKELRIIDIALLPEMRCLGIGSAILHAMLDRASRRSLTTSLYAEYNNPVLRLYLRLGFKEIGENGIYRHLERMPETLAPNHPLPTLHNLFSNMEEIAHESDSGT